MPLSLSSLVHPPCPNRRGVAAGDSSAAGERVRGVCRATAGTGESGGTGTGERAWGGRGERMGVGRDESAGVPACPAARVMGRAGWRWACGVARRGEAVLDATVLKVDKGAPKGVGTSAEGAGRGGGTQRRVAWRMLAGVRRRPGDVCFGGAGWNEAGWEGFGDGRGREKREDERAWAKEDVRERCEVDAI